MALKINFLVTLSAKWLICMPISSGSIPIESGSGNHFSGEKRGHGQKKFQKPCSMHLGFSFLNQIKLNPGRKITPMNKHDFICVCATRRGPHLEQCNEVIVCFDRTRRQRGYAPSTLPSVVKEIPLKTSPLVSKWHRVALRFFMFSFYYVIVKFTQ